MTKEKIIEAIEYRMEKCMQKIRLTAQKLDDITLSKEDRKMYIRMQDESFDIYHAFAELYEYSKME